MQVRVRYRIEVFGLVQGVWYRKGTEQKAKALKLNGWVRNQPDGSVLIEVEGPPEFVDQLIAWCAEGPPDAQVELVRSTRQELTPLPPFHVIR